MNYLEVDCNDINLPTFSYKLGMERLPSAQLRAMQLEYLKPFLQRVYEHNSFFRARFDAVGLKPSHVTSWQDFKKLVPFVTKQEVLEDQRDYPPYGTRLGVPRQQLRVMQTTSGTTGIGQEVYGLTAVDTVYEGLNSAQCVRGQGVEPGHHVALTYPISTSSAGQCIIEGLRMYGAVPVLLGLYDAQTKFNFMKSLETEYMITAPAYLTRLSMLAKDLGIDPRRDLPRLNSICVATEAFPLSWAERMRDFWSKPIHELYGSTQQGSVIGYTCTACTATINGKRGLLHFPEWMCILELIDPTTNEEVGPGEEGELILTTFAREASPLVRFRTGDLMIRGDVNRCTSGRTTLAAEAGTVRRVDDMIKIKASNVWPASVDNVIFSYAEADEYNARVYLDEAGAEKVQIKLEFKPDVKDQGRKGAVLREMASEIKNRTAVTMEIVEVPQGTVTRFEWKPKRWKDERMEGLGGVKL